MSKDRFELLLKFYHFSSNQEHHADQDRWFKPRSLLDLLTVRFKPMYIPDPIISIDETMVPWEERLFLNNTFLGERTNMA